MTRTPLFRDPSGKFASGSIAEAGAWTIGGIDQWVMIRGRDAGNPLLVILHGGPGSSETALFRAFNADLEGAFTVVYWDQRGAGRSYAKSIPPESMTVDRFVADLDELVETLLKRFARRQVVLLGHSWGSVLGVLYASAFPAKVAAYVGTGQVADMAASEAASYAFVLARAEQRGHRKATQELRAIGPPPHTQKALMRQRRWLMAFGGAVAPGFSLPKLAWRALRTPEASLLDIPRLVQGSGFSIRYLWDTLMATDIGHDHRRFDMPVFFLLGRHDMQVVATVAADYFETIEAPHKALVWFENSGHFLPFEEPDRFNRVMIDQVRPFALTV